MSETERMIAPVTLPVVDDDESTIKDALQHTYRRGWTRLATSAGGRTTKYRHLLDEALGLSDPQMDVLCVLMLRGPQTPGELKGRTERLHRFSSLEELDEVLARLSERELVVRLPRRPGQKEERYAQLLGGEPGDEPAAPSHAASAAEDDDRLAEVEAALQKLRDELAALRAELRARD